MILKNLYTIREDNILLTNNLTVSKIDTVVHLCLLNWRW